MSIYKNVAQGQTNADIAIQYGGCYEYIAQLLTDNPNIQGPEDTQQPGTRLIIQSPCPKLTDNNIAINNEWVTRGYKCSSGALPDEVLSTDPDFDPIETEGEQFISPDVQPDFPGQGGQIIQQILSFRNI